MLHHHILRHLNPDVCATNQHRFACYCTIMLNVIKTLVCAEMTSVFGTWADGLTGDIVWWKIVLKITVQNGSKLRILSCISSVFTAHWNQKQTLWDKQIRIFGVKTLKYTKLTQKWQYVVLFFCTSIAVFMLMYVWILMPIYYYYCFLSE